MRRALSLRQLHSGTGESFSSLATPIKRRLIYKMVFSVFPQAEPEAPSAPAHLNLPPGKHPISVLMEYGQKSGSTVEFELLSQEGPPHDPRYVVALAALGKTWIFYLITFSLTLDASLTCLSVLSQEQDPNWWFFSQKYAVLSPRPGTGSGPTRSALWEYFRPSW